MSKCSVCGEPHSPFIMNNKRVCMRCDELLFDVEIEIDEQREKTQPEIVTTQSAKTPSTTVSKK